MTLALERSPSQPHRRLWTRQEFEHAIAAGVFVPEDNLELIEGELVVKMTQNGPHATAYRLSEKAMNRVFGEGYDVRGQLPLALSVGSAPEPDIAIVTGSPRDYAADHPTGTETVLVIEISDSTLLYDQTTKAALYARAGIAEYWILNLSDRLLEIHRAPAPMTEAMLGHGYRSIVRLPETETASPLAMPSAFFHIADLLP